MKKAQKFSKETLEEVKKIDAELKTLDKIHEVYISRLEILWEKRDKLLVQK